MELTKIQKKFIESNIFHNTIIKGKKATGKKESLLHRILYLQNNYAFENGDSIVFVDKSKNEINKTIKEFLEIEMKYKFDYYSFLLSKESPKFMTFNNILNIYTSNHKIATLEEINEVVNNSILKIKNNKCKKLNKDNVHLIINEIRYIKNNRIKNEEEYMVLGNTPLKFRKHSNSRKTMYSLFLNYNNELRSKLLLDYEDALTSAINNIDIMENRPIHLIINNAQEYSKLELEFLMKLRKNKSYGTLTLSIDVDKGENLYSPLVKKGRVCLKKVFNDNKKVFNFKNNIANNEEYNEVEEKEFTFRNLKHNTDIKFKVLEEKNNIKVENHIFSNEELELVPVFNNIAAGEPILINPSQEDMFFIPKSWIKGGNKRFILKVQGNSMINAKINDGDYVVIEQNNSPNNGDIVAVNIEGSATLKRLKIDKDKILLMPENEKYKPIILREDSEFYILGKAIGVISA